MFCYCYMRLLEILMTGMPIGKVCISCIEFLAIICHWSKCCYIIEYRNMCTRIIASPANAPFERSTRSRSAKKSLLSRRCLRNPRPFWIDLRNGHRMHGSMAAIFLRMPMTWSKAGTLENRRGLTALTQSMGCKKRNILIKFTRKKP